MSDNDDREAPQVGQVWRHNRSGDLYRIALLYTDERSGLPGVCYQSLADGRIWGRTLDSFLGLESGGALRFEREEGE